MSALAAVDDAHPCCPRCSALCAYLRVTADSMGLRDWTVDVDHEVPLIEGALATVMVAEGRRTARFSFAPGFLELDPAEARHAVVHELAHVPLAEIPAVIEQSISGEIGGSTYRVIMASVRREVEQVADWYAATLAPHLAPPGW